MKYARSSSITEQIKTAIRQSGFYAPIRRKRLERSVRRTGAYPDWADLLEGHEKNWQAALAQREGPRVLLATSLGLHATANTVDSFLAVALTLRGCRVEILHCDGSLPACQVAEHTFVPSIPRFAKKGPQPDLCRTCVRAGFSTFKPFGLNHVGLSSLVSPDEAKHEIEIAREKASEVLRTQKANGVDEHGLAGALRFFARSTLPDGPYERQVLERYLAAAQITENATRSLLSQRRFDVVVAHHGIYTPQGAIARVAEETATRLVTWHPSYRRGRVIFEHDQTYHRGMISEPIERWRSRPLSATQRADLESYLASRMTGSQDWITFQRRAPQNRFELERTLGFSFEKPTFLLLGNVAWDARLHYEQSAYGDMIKWAKDTVEWFAARSELQLIVRCHPGEVLTSPRAQDRLDFSLLDAFGGELPENIKVLSPEDEVNTYALAAQSKAALIYNTKMGVELAAAGMPVIVAGDAWIRGKGFSYDASSPEEYRTLLEAATTLEPLTTDQREAAERYAYHFFFRRCIPLNIFDEEKGWPLCALKADAFDQAHAGADEGVDILCQGIMTGAPFEYD